MGNTKGRTNVLPESSVPCRLRRAFRRRAVFRRIPRRLSTCCSWKRCSPPSTDPMRTLTPVQYDIIYNVTSLGLASMMASTVFFFLRMSSFSERYKAALCFTGLVTFIAAYHYFRIFNSFVEAYTPCEVVDGVV